MKSFTSGSTFAFRETLARLDGRAWVSEAEELLEDDPDGEAGRLKGMWLRRRKVLVRMDFVEGRGLVHLE